MSSFWARSRSFPPPRPTLHNTRGGKCNLWNLQCSDLWAVVSGLSCYKRRGRSTCPPPRPATLCLAGRAAQLHPAATLIYAALSFRQASPPSVEQLTSCTLPPPPFVTPHAPGQVWVPCFDPRAWRAASSHGDSTRHVWSPMQGALGSLAQRRPC